MRKLAFIAALLIAQTASAQNINDQLQKILQKGNGQEALGQGIAIASLLGCTGKEAGKEATDAFYKEMQTVGKQVEAYCKAKRPDDARALVLSTLKTKQSDPVLAAARNCYSTQKANFDMMAGEKLAGDMEMYSRWAADPALATSEMRNDDICK